MDNNIDWREVGKQLAAPFAPESVDWRPQGKPSAGARVQLVAYVDARDVQDRLDQVVGPGAWSFELEPIVTAGGELTVGRGRLTIYGVSKDGVGTKSQWEASKGCDSDCLKRAAVQWGVARYLYRLPQVWVTLDAKGQVPESMKKQLADSLRKRFGEGLVAA